MRHCTGYAQKFSGVIFILTHYLFLTVFFLISLSSGSDIIAQDLEWARSAGSSSYDEGRGIVMDDFGNSYVTGMFEGSAVFGAGEALETTLTSAGSLDLFVAKYDMNGNLVWAKSAGGTAFDVGFSIDIDPAANIHVTGRIAGVATFGSGEANETVLSSAGDNDMYVAKYDADGDLLWARRAGGPLFDIGESIKADANGNSYVAGRFRDTAVFGSGQMNEISLTSNGDYDLFVAKYDPSGELIWTRQGGGVSTDGAEGLALDGNGNSYVTGAFKGTAVLGPGELNETTIVSAGGEDTFVAKYDTNGNLIWVKRAGSSTGNGGKDISVDDNGNSYVTGSFEGSMVLGPGETNETTLISSGSWDAFLAKYGSGGELIWAKQAGGTAADFSRGVAVSASGMSYITGEFRGSAVFGGDEAGETTLTNSGNNDIFVASFASDGSLLWAQSAGGNSTDIGFRIAVTSAGDIGVTGLFNSTALFGEGLNPVNLSSEGSGDIFVARYGIPNQDPDCSAAAIADQEADANCQAIISGSDVTGITDPDGDALNITVSPTTLSLGANNVTVSADDGNGGSCSVIINVIVVGGTGTISGKVTSNGVGLEGVTVKLLNGNPPTNVVDDQSTDINGDYIFADIAVGSYTVMVVEPLGYSLTQNDLETVVECQSFTTVNFDFTETVIVNNARSKGYWKHQFDVYVENKGNAQESEADLTSFILEVGSRYNTYFEIFDGMSDGVDDFAEWQSILSVKGNAGMEAKATAQLAAVVLNIMSLKIGQYEVVSDDNKTAADALTYVSELIEDGDAGNDETAKDIAEQVNSQQIIAAGLISPTQSILYKPQDPSDSDEADAVNTSKYALLPNYPNPFNPITTIQFSLPKSDLVTLTIYNGAGQIVRRLLVQELPAGLHRVTWDATDDTGQQVASGIYLYQLQAGAIKLNRQMLLLR